MENCEVYMNVHSISSHDENRSPRMTQYLKIDSEPDDNSPTKDDAHGSHHSKHKINAPKYRANRINEIIDEHFDEKEIH